MTFLLEDKTSFGKITKSEQKAKIMIAKNVSMEIYDFVHRQSIKIPSFDYQSRVRYLTRSHLNALKIFPSFSSKTTNIY